MANLPRSRVELPSPPFTTTGVDFFGPIITKAGYRGGRREKRYGVTFTCLQTRAVHMEVAQSLSTNDFLSAFSRFVARRSRPKVMFSDQGTNFVGAEREMRNIVKELVKDKELEKELHQKALKWTFNPPAAPHMGGAWESMVKLAKRSIAVTTNGAQLTDEELSTVVAECEAMLNNRPMSYVGSEPDDLDPLTPAHFLNTKQLTPLLPSEIIVENISPRRRWLFMQSITSRIWKRWQQEYLPCLQRRLKWNQPTRNLEIGDLVLILDPNQPRGQWLRGKIEETYPDAHGLVRSAKVYTVKGTYHRPVTKLILLLPEEGFK